MSDIREGLRQEFIAKSGWYDAEITPLQADASFRRYFRLKKPGKKVMLMDAPPETEDVNPFVLIAKHLKRLGFSAPRILAEDLDNGFLLLEDFGDSTFTNLLNKGTSEEELYQLGTDCLIALHNSPEAADILTLPAYSQTILQDEADLLLDWYYPEVTDMQISDEAREAYHAAWAEIYNTLPVQRSALVLRDFHVDNLMLLKRRKGVKRCGLLDFQDALIGSPAYDLVSLLEDARRDVSPDIQERMKERYLTEVYHSTWESLMPWYNFLAAQRHAKVIGIFTRLYRRDGKSIYLQHIPRVCRLLEKHLANPNLTPLQQWFEIYFSDFVHVPEKLNMNEL